MTDHVTAPVMPADLFARQQTITGLRQLADFLEANPRVPVSEYGWDYNVYTPRGCDTCGRAKVDQIAALVGAPVNERTHYTATKTFGRVSYRVVHIPQRVVAEHEART